MTLRIITPASGAAGISVPWDCGTVWQPAGQVLDVPPGGALESAIGLANLTAVSGTEQASIVTGSPPDGTTNT
jgi:hypothetical protein